MPDARARAAARHAARVAPPSPTAAHTIKKAGPKTTRWAPASAPATISAAQAPQARRGAEGEREPPLSALRQPTSGDNLAAEIYANLDLELRQQVGYWKSRHRDALKRIAALEQEIEQLEGEKRQLQADLFGRRSETKPLNDRSNHLDDPQDDSQQPKRKRGQQPENHGPKRRDYSRLPVREDIRRTAPRAMCLPRLRSTVTSPK